MAGLRRVNDFNNLELDDMLENKYLELLIDTISKTVYHVSPLVGHARAASLHLGIPESEINKSNACHLVSALVEIELRPGNQLPAVKQVIIGRSGLEIGHKIHHSNKQLVKAKLIVERIMMISEQIGEVLIPVDISQHEFVLK